MHVERAAAIPDSPATPAAPAPTTRWGQRLTRLAFGVALCIAAGMIGLRFGRSLGTEGVGRLGLDAWHRVAVIAASLLAILLVLLFHEIGHLLGGRLVGFRGFLLIVGPMRLERSEAGWAMHLNKDLALYGGLAASAATDDRDLRRRTAVMVAGGPVASAVLAVGAGLALHALNLLPLDAGSAFSSVLAFATLQTLALTSAVIGFITLVPMHTSGFLSDGARLLRLLRGGPFATRDSAIQAIIGSSLSGVRPRDWSPALLSAACELRDGSTFEFCGLQFAQMHTADLGNTEHSVALLRQLLQHVDRMPRMFIAGIHLDAARQFALAGYTDEARARIALAKGPALGAPHLKPLAEAALLVAEGRAAEAEELLETIRPMLARSIDRGAARWLSESLESAIALGIGGQRARQDQASNRM